MEIAGYLLLALIVGGVLWVVRHVKPHPPLYDKPRLNTRGTDPDDPLSGVH
jgi:hypothetical protein